MNTPPTWAAAIAPVPVSFFEHTLQRRKEKAPEIAIEELSNQLIRDIERKRHDTFVVMDSWVKTEKLTVAWLKETLAQHHRPVAKSTFTYWQTLGLLQMERQGRPEPLSSQALLIIRMIDAGQRNTFPTEGLPEEESWWCYAQHDSSSDIFQHPANKLNELPETTLCWTPTTSAWWLDGWTLIGKGEGYLGCVRFAGIKVVQGEITYDLSLQELTLWDEKIAALYQDFPGDEQGQLQALIITALHRLARNRLTLGQNNNTELAVPSTG